MSRFMDENEENALAEAQAAIRRREEERIAEQQRLEADRVAEQQRRDRRHGALQASVWILVATLAITVVVFAAWYGGQR